MDSVDILFRSPRFNLSETRSEYINPECYGDDVTAWLAERLKSKGYHAPFTGPEDWGWYVDIGKAPGGYFLAVSGFSNQQPDRPNFGEWRIIVRKKRTLWQKITGQNKTSREDKIFVDLFEVLRADDEISDVRFDENP